MADISQIHNRKVAIIGTGNVGASIAYALTIRNLAREIVLIDKDEGRASGEALDIQHGIPYMGVSSVYSGSYRDCGNCDLIIITAVYLTRTDKVVRIAQGYTKPVIICVHERITNYTLNIRIRQLIKHVRSNSEGFTITCGMGRAKNIRSERSFTKLLVGIIDLYRFGAYFFTVKL